MTCNGFHYGKAFRSMEDGGAALVPAPIHQRPLMTSCTWEVVPGKCKEAKGVTRSAWPSLNASNRSVLINYTVIAMLPWPGSLRPLWHKSCFTANFCTMLLFPRTFLAGDGAPSPPSHYSM
ncbi:hypothetical protein RvY_18976 [Ramazzottius varieornatus]|uniref:Uncharacterized protein n=1 Tax=Ramazzottius varieornatus TaxID=947166 RepID=A0A1D1W7R1_RAMVA|nr:hypothetical protein RvY_18976 [Ramazzottius varieornatus]